MVIFNPSAPSPYLSYNQRLTTTRALFVFDHFPVGAPTSRHENDAARMKYEDLCLQGFSVQGNLSPHCSNLLEPFRIIDRVGWTYTVLDLKPFCPRVVRELISNVRNTAEDGVFIRGTHFEFDLDVINTVLLTPAVERSFDWESCDLSLAISVLTGYRFSGWSSFHLTGLIPPYDTLYRVCKMNWLPGLDTDAIIKMRLRLVYAIANGRAINFGELLYDQVRRMGNPYDLGPTIIQPSLIYQVLLFQKDIPALAGDEDLIGRPVNIWGPSTNMVGPRGREVIE